MSDTPQPESAETCTGRPDCPSGDLHYGYCLGLYRTEHEVQQGLIPPLRELKRRRNHQLALMTLGHGRKEPS